MRTPTLLQAEKRQNRVRGTQEFVVAVVVIQATSNAEHFTRREIERESHVRVFWLHAVTLRTVLGRSILGFNPTKGIQRTAPESGRQDRPGARREGTGFGQGSIIALKLLKDCQTRARRTTGISWAWTLT